MEYSKLGSLDEKIGYSDGLFEHTHPNPNPSAKPRQNLY